MNSLEFMEITQEYCHFKRPSNAQQMNLQREREREGGREREREGGERENGGGGKS